MFWLGTQLPQVTKINELWKKLSNTAASLKCLHFFFWIWGHCSSYSFYFSFCLAKYVNCLYCYQHRFLVFPNQFIICVLNRRKKNVFSILRLASAQLLMMQSNFEREKEIETRMHYLHMYSHLLMFSLGFDFCRVTLGYIWKNSVNDT